VTYGPLGFGFLTGSMTRERALAIDDWRRDDGLTAEDKVDEALALVEALRPVASDVGITVAQLALAWNRQQPGVTSAIAGSRDPKHAIENAEAGNIELDADTIATLDRLIAG
jgi:aryl-alcohol dehydrogenase-like predicted oxidoreductase